MRYGKEHKRDQHAAIVRQAADRFRKDGLAAVGVRQLMTDAGLTHGAFYTHFPSRETLVAEAIAEGLAETLAALNEVVSAAEPGTGLEAFVESYLDPRLRARTDKGCIGAGLAPEIARENPPVRQAFETGINRIVDLLAAQLPDHLTGEARPDRARATFALLMGALQLIRTAPGQTEADAIRAAAYRHALALARM